MNTVQRTWDGTALKPTRRTSVTSRTIKIPCEIYSRVVGYLRPVQNWNKGKRQEFLERRTYQVKSGDTAPQTERREPTLAVADIN